MKLKRKIKKYYKEFLKQYGRNPLYKEWLVKEGAPCSIDIAKREYKVKTLKELLYAVSIYGEPKIVDFDYFSQFSLPCKPSELRRYNLIFGPPRCGKTISMVKLYTEVALQGDTVFYVVRNSKQDIRSIISDFNKYFKINKIKSIPVYNIAEEKATNVEWRKRANKQGQIILVMANIFALAKANLTTCLQGVSQSNTRMHIGIDEDDLYAYGLDSSENINQIEMAFNSISTIYPWDSITAITATPGSNFFNNIEYKTFNIPVLENYIHLEDSAFMEINFSFDNLTKDTKLPKEFLEILRNLKVKEQSNILSNTIINNNNLHYELVDKIRLYREFNDIAIIIFNEGICKVRLPEEDEKVFDLISEAVNYIYYDKKFRYAFYIGGKQIGRAQTISDSKGRFPLYEILMFDNSAKTKPIDTIIQQTSRVCGIYEDNRTRIVYSDKYLMSKIKKSIQINEIIKKSGKVENTILINPEIPITNKSYAYNNYNKDDTFDSNIYKIEENLDAIHEKYNSNEYLLVTKYIKTEVAIDTNIILDKINTQERTRFDEFIKQSLDYIQNNTQEIVVGNGVSLVLYKTLENKSRYAHWVGRDPRKEKTTTERSYFHGIDSSNKTFSIILLNTIEMLQKISFNIQYLVMANEDGSYRVYNKIITEEEENSYKFKKAI